MESKKSFVPGGEYIQTVKIVLKDGREGIFTGKAICSPSGEPDLFVEGIFLTEPEKLHEDWFVDEVDLSIVRDSKDTLH